MHCESEKITSDKGKLKKQTFNQKRMTTLMENTERNRQVPYTDDWLPGKN